MCAASAVSICIKLVYNRVIELRVSADDLHFLWRWSVRFAEGDILADGAELDKTSAQRAAQQALRMRLQKAGVYNFTTSCSWQDLIE